VCLSKPKTCREKKRRIAEGDINPQKTEQSNATGSKKTDDGTERSKRKEVHRKGGTIKDEVTVS